MKHTQKLVALLLLCSLFTGCAQGTKSPDETTSPTADTTAAPAETTAPVETEYVYPYPTEGFGGDTFNILAMKDMYSIHFTMVPAELSGEVVNDALFKRNALVEEKFDIDIVEHAVNEQWDYKVAVETARNVINANLDEYQVMYLPTHKTAPLVLSGSFLNTHDIDSIQLDQPWWYDSYNNEVTINDALYGAMGGANLAVQDGIRILSFNKEMLESLGLDTPYALVREGKWTLDRFGEYLTKAANLNSDPSADWIKEGTTVYGYSNNKSALGNFIIGSGELYVENNDGKLELTFGSERTFRAIDKMKEIFTQTDAKAIFCPNGNANAGDTGNPGYHFVFKNQRSLFTHLEIAALQEFRALEFEYGVAPWPKLDEAQTSYYCALFSGAPAAYFPVTLADPEKAGYILDAMAYEGERTVTPEFQGNSVEYKGLRDPESIEMMEIIKQSATPFTYSILGISLGTMSSQASADIVNGETKTASAVASSKDAVIKGIEEAMASWQ